MTEPSFVQLGLLPLCLAQCPSHRQECQVVVGKDKQAGTSCRMDPGRRLAAEGTDDTLCEAAEDSPC